MYGHDTLFLYYSRRAQQEQVAAINARNVAAADAHRELSSLHATRAVMAVADAPSNQEVQDCASRLFEYQAADAASKRRTFSEAA